MDDPSPRPVARGLSVVGDRWTLLVLRDCFLGVRWFEDFQGRLGMPRLVLGESGIRSIQPVNPRIQA
jgi:DNA-binding HxlR family transcriptional regulator